MWTEQRDKRGVSHLLGGRTDLRTHSPTHPPSGAVAIVHGLPWSRRVRDHVLPMVSVATA